MSELDAKTEVTHVEQDAELYARAYARAYNTVYEACNADQDAAINAAEAITKKLMP